MADDRRGLLTDREHEILQSDGADVTDKYYGVVVSRVRNKIERIAGDLPALEKHDTLGDELRRVVCNDNHAIRKVRTHSRETREDDADALAALNLDAERRAAVAAMYDLLREQGTARKADFTGDVYPEHPAGFGTPDGWWNALGSGSTATGEKGSLGDLPGVRKPPSSGRPTWEYVGG